MASAKRGAVCRDSESHSYQERLRRQDLELDRRSLRHKTEGEILETMNITIFF